MDKNSDNIRVAIIAGGTGLIGSALVPLLLNDGYRVKILTRNAKKSKSHFDNVEIVEWSGKPDNGLVSLLENSEVLVNLAGYNIATLWTKKNKRKIIDSRILPTQALAQAVNMCKNPPKVFVQASAVGIYPFNSDTILNENSPAGKGFLSELVSSWENEALACANATRLITIRTGIVLSDKGGFLPKIAKTTRYFMGAILGNGKHVVPWIHIADHVRAVKFLIDNQFAAGAFNLTAPALNSYSDITQAVASLYKRPVLFKVPSFILGLLPGNMADEVLLANQPVQPQRLVQLGFKWEYPNLPDAIVQLLAK